MNGLDVRPPAKRYQFIPFGLTRVQERERPYWQAGADLRYAVTPATAVYGTVNPDFATVEADEEEEINLTRFELQLPEKRQFFLQGQEHFRQRIRTFYSRRIADIYGGGKLLGKEGAWSSAVFSTWTKASDTIDEANYSVVRVARDVRQRSIVGFLAASRLVDGVNQGSMGFDTNVLVGKTFNFTGQLVQSYGPSDSGTWAYFVRPSYDSPTGHVHLRYTHMGDRFADNVNAIGFVRDDDRRELDSDINKTLWIRGQRVERVEYGSNYNIYWSTAGALRSWSVSQDVEIELANRWSIEADCREEYIVFEKAFRNRAAGVSVGYNTRQYQQILGSVELGRNFDADFQLWELSAQHKVTEALSVEYGLQRLWLDPDPEAESTWIHVVRASQFFTKDLFLSVFFQTNTSNRPQQPAAGSGARRSRRLRPRRGGIPRRGRTGLHHGRAPGVRRESHEGGRRAGDRRGHAVPQAQGLHAGRHTHHPPGAHAGESATRTTAHESGAVALTPRHPAVAGGAAATSTSHAYPRGITS